MRCSGAVRVGQGCSSRQTAQSHAKTVTNNLPILSVLAVDIYFIIKAICLSSVYSFFKIHPKNSSPISPCTEIDIRSPKFLL